MGTDVSDTDTASSARHILREVFGYRAFRGPQADIVDHVCAGGDALVLMPTGGGKSLCYQIPAIARARMGQGVGQTSGRVLTTGKQNKGRGVHGRQW